MILYLDTETRGDRFADGVYIYTTFGMAAPILAQWALDEGEVQVHEWSAEVASQLSWLISQADRVVMHNAEFDRTVLAACGVVVPLIKSYCTMAQARRHGLPGSLDKLCEVFRVPDGKAKQKNGRQLMNLFCKPKPDGSYHDKRSHPDRWEEFTQYARHDVLAMRELHKLMPHWNDAYEEAHWIVDQQLNARGFEVDEELAQVLVQKLARVKRASDEAVCEATGFEVTSITQVGALQAVLEAEGVLLPDMTAATLERRANDENLSEHARQLIRLRLEGAKTSTRKYNALLRTRGEDGRIRGVKVYCGAARTGRWSARILQTDNLPRPALPPEVLALDAEALKAGADYALSDLPLPHLASQCLRGTIVAPPGKHLLVADLANIEGRVAAWVSREIWKLQAFKAYDQGEGPDLYKLSYARAFDEPVESIGKDWRRQLGKVFELMLGYGGGVAAFLTGCETYRVDPATLKRAIPSIPPELWGKSEGSRKWFIEKLHDKLAKELDPELWRVCWCLTRLWREANEAIEGMWDDLGDAFCGVQSLPEGRVVKVRHHLEVDRQGMWTRIRLPSGRYLCYPDVRIDEKGFTFLGINPYTHKWGRTRTWGGTLFENVCQAIARDILAEGLLACACGGAHPILHIHDELICEERDEHPVLDLDGLIYRMTHVEWAEGLPLAAAGFKTKRYYKEV
jgi:DNA polymerase bacteriophage-type